VFNWGFPSIQPTPFPTLTRAMISTDFPVISTKKLWVQLSLPFNPTNYVPHSHSSNDLNELGCRKTLCGALCQKLGIGQSSLFNEFSCVLFRPETRGVGCNGKITIVLRSTVQLDLASDVRFSYYGCRKTLHGAFSQKFGNEWSPRFDDLPCVHFWLETRGVGCMGEISIALHSSVQSDLTLEVQFSCYGCRKTLSSVLSKARKRRISTFR